MNEIQAGVKALSADVQAIVDRIDRMEKHLEVLVTELAKGGRQHIAVAVDTMVADLGNARRDITYLRTQWERMVRPGSTWPGDSK